MGQKYILHHTHTNSDLELIFLRHVFGRKAENIKETFMQTRKGKRNSTQSPELRIKPRTHCGKSLTKQQK